jgi:hypothetical protein
MNEPSPKQGSMMVPSTIRPRPAAPLSRPSRLGQKTRRVWAILCFAAKKFFRINGAQWAGAFAFNAFFSLFPLIVLFVTIASSFIDRDRAGKEVIAYVESYVPISGEMQRQIFDTLAGVIKAREQAGAVAFLILVWTGLQCFATLICATNRAWSTAVYNWWRLPLKSLVLLGITAGAVLLGMAVPVLMRMAKGWLFPVHDFGSWVYGLGSFFIPLLVVFFGLSLFYRLAPGAMVYTTGSAEEMIANCDVLITQFSSTAFVGLALGKETYSDFDMDELRRLMPVQNGSAAVNIADVCRRFLEED